MLGTKEVRGPDILPQLSTQPPLQIVWVDIDMSDDEEQESLQQDFDIKKKKQPPTKPQSGKTDTISFDDNSLSYDPKTSRLIDTSLEGNLIV